MQVALRPLARPGPQPRVRAGHVSRYQPDTARTWSSSNRTPVGRGNEPPISSTNAGRRSSTTGSPVRSVPRSRPSRGEPRGVSGAFTRPHAGTVPDRGSTRRASSAGSPVATTPSACTTSQSSSLRRPAPHAPTRSSSMAHADVTGRTPMPTRPTGTVGSQCRPKIRSTPSTPCAAITSCDPPGSSSAGWNSSRTRPGSTEAGAAAAPSRIAVCTSWRHACETPGTVDAHDSPEVSATAGASMSARRATQRGPLPTSQITPVSIGSTRGRRPGKRRTSAAGRPQQQSWWLAVRARASRRLGCDTSLGSGTSSPTTRARSTALGRESPVRVDDHLRTPAGCSWGSGCTATRACPATSCQPGCAGEFFATACNGSAPCPVEGRDHKPSGRSGESRWSSVSTWSGGGRR
ncbi:hypothetical protein EDD40_0358 [Saccharothrix texasensis]|uniref:Uncharacterized protein n=1 Tax=Saccharothrix texasensis TaxID=103734 RepID=A0A3N1GY35_9PSEU|nr:hypothetical protein EDD40_0358 [Saccharothrix texasensis]